MKNFILLCLFSFLTACPQTEPDTTPTAEPSVDRCEENNGGCGESNVFSCEDTGAENVLCHYDHTEDWKALTKDVATIDHGESWPSTIVVHGETAFPVISFAESQRAFIAAARVGQGKVMHWAHETYFYTMAEQTDDAGQLLLNALQWMSDKEQPIIGVASQLSALATFLGNHNYPVVDIALSNLDAVDILIRETYEDLSDSDDQALQNFVNEGKGLITAGLAWWWSYQIGNENVAENYPGNQMIWNSGLTITGDWGEPGSHQTSAQPPRTIENASLAFTTILQHLQENTLNQEEVSIASATVAHGVAHLSLAFEDFFLLADDYVETVDFEIITAQQPLITAEEPLRALRARIESKYARKYPIELIEAHPSAEVFPGALTGSVVSVNHTQTINATYEGRNATYIYSNPAEPRWESTGYYAAAGESVFVTLPENALGYGIDLLIGSHTDLLWAKESIERFPNITRRYPITEATTEIKSAFGGLVYLRIPAGTELGDISINFEGGYLAPTYFDGETTLSDWQNTIKNYPGPWAELVSDKFVLTFPSHLARALDNPDEMMAFWNDSLDAAADLDMTSRERARAERFVLDEQISLGWMHSGYPLMAFIEASPEFVDLDYIFENSIWGPFHEIGHNHQAEAWLLPGTTETTCNLWSTYMTENILQMSLEDNPTLAPLAREERILAYFAGGKDFYNDWNVWVALDTYLQLKERFGWDFYKTIFPLYREMPEVQWPTTDQGRIDLWVIKSSEVAEHDLSDFYLAWGFPITQNALNAVAHLPDWTDHPMLDY